MGFAYIGHGIIPKHSDDCTGSEYSYIILGPDADTIFESCWGGGWRARRCRRGAEDFPTGSPGEGAPDRESEGGKRGRERERQRERESDKEIRERERERERGGGVVRGRERGLEPYWPPGG